MKNLLIVILLLIITSMVAFYFLKNKGHDTESIINRVQRIDIKVECSRVQNMLLASTVTVFADNLSSRTHENVTVRITGFDKRGNRVKRKETSFLRKLEPNSSISKIITFPPKVKRCECALIDSNPTY